MTNISLEYISIYRTYSITSSNSINVYVAVMCSVLKARIW